MIKAVIFDFFGVLCSEEHWQLLKSEVSTPGKFGELARSVHLGEMSWQKFVEKVAAETGQTPDKVQELYASEKINLPLASYIEKLHQRYKTALLSNASGGFLKPLLKRSGLANLFDEIIISSEVGIIKPDPRIYEYAVERLGVSVSQTVFVDDAPARVEGAAKVGIHTVLYRDFEQMKTDLEKILSPVSDN